MVEAYEPTKKVDEEKLKERLKDRFWRLNNLYYVKDEHGDKVLFRMRPEQKKLFDEIHTRNIILKARQLGFTTFIQIFILDACLWTPNLSAGVIAQTKDDAQEIMENKIGFAFDNMPKWLKQMIGVATKKTIDIIRFGNGSQIRVGTSLRGGTFQILHISEYGKICAKFPERAKEVRTGALNTVHAQGLIFIESTAEGRDGHFYELSLRSLNKQRSGEKLGPFDFKFHFFPWYSKYKTSSKGVTIPDRLKKYFRQLKQERGIGLSPHHMAWYMKTEEDQQGEMKREFPSFPEEAFEASHEAAYFAKQMAYLREHRRITDVPWVPQERVHCFLDIGRDKTAIWFFQDIYNQLRFFDYFEDEGEDLTYYITVLRNRGVEDFGRPYDYSTIWLPHDGKRKYVTTTESAEDIFYNAGFNPRSVNRTMNKNDSIDGARRILYQCLFDKSKCEKGLDHLDKYSKEWDNKNGCFKEKPRHDEHSHGSDAFMTFSDGYVVGLEEEEWKEEKWKHQPLGRSATTGY